ncbi:MAG: sigma-70 family RNA polymerase sigma factor [Verrucomicrobiae bacterium]|nr:sigma-70 family RNA polymerase sigma factor [Verrucomicrobiae bacterium]
MSAELTPPTPGQPLPEPPDGEFRTTRWTQVNRAKADSPEGRRALTELCNAYYEPVATFLRCDLRDADAARELAHDFFAHMLAGGTIDRAGPERGRFRSYLLGAVKHFLSHQRESRQRLKRGGGVENISLHETEARSVPDAGVLSPDAAFDRQWALTVVAHALAALRRECVAEGRADFFERVKPWLTGDAAHGDQAALAAAGGLNANALKVAVHRLKRRFRQLLKAEVAGTLDDPGLVESEMRALFAALES